MTFDHAVAILAHARRDAADVVPILLKLATMAHVLGQTKSRDDSIESAAELIRHLGRLPERSGSGFAIARLPS